MEQRCYHRVAAPLVAPWRCAGRPLPAAAAEAVLGAGSAAAACSATFHHTTLHSHTILWVLLHRTAVYVLSGVGEKLARRFSEVASTATILAPTSHSILCSCSTPATAIHHSHSPQPRARGSAMGRNAFKRAAGLLSRAASNGLAARNSEGLSALPLFCVGCNSACPCCARRNLTTATQRLGLNGRSRHLDRPCATPW